MKKCPHCGKEFPDATAICPADGQALLAATPPAIPALVDRQLVVDDEHIRLLSIFHFVIAGLALCGILFLFLHYLLMSSMFSNPDLFKGQPNAPQLPKNLFNIFIWFYVFMGAILVSAALGNFLSGLFLRQKKHRIFSIVIGALNCLQIPFGTVLGIFTIIVLARDSVRKNYQ